jgi:23S rRNA (pseudouridine1915-N3)-methyltransferase
VRLVVLCVGTPRATHITSAIREYEERAARYFRLEVIEVPAARYHGGDPGQARLEEAESLSRRMPATLASWALTREGTAMSSRELADELGRVATYGEQGICFLIGGAFGLNDALAQSCQRRMSLSALTFPHDVARLILAEQIYRAGTILRGEPYHKGV